MRPNIRSGHTSAAVAGRKVMVFGGHCAEGTAGTEGQSLHQNPIRKAKGFYGTHNASLMGHVPLGPTIPIRLSHEATGAHHTGAERVVQAECNRTL